MCSEYVRRRYDLKRGIKIELPLDNVETNAFEREERRVPFVHVKYVRRDAQRGQRFDAADPEHDFLTHPHFEVATIKLGGDPPVLGTVFSNIGIEKINAYAANAEFPKLGENFSFQNWHRNEQVRVTAADFANREVIKALIQIDRFLNAFLVDLLPEITMAVKQADPDEV